jgi:hypothetical protein
MKAGNSGIDISNSLTKHWAFAGKSRFLRSRKTSMIISSHVDSIGKPAERVEGQATTLKEAIHPQPQQRIG